MFCALSGALPQQPVFCSKDNHVYERELLVKYLREHDSVSPMNGERVNVPEDLLEIEKSQVLAPKPPSHTSIPATLLSLQNEWDALMLETFTLKKQYHATQQDLSNALYENDAAKRVIARLIKERDEARQKLSEFKASFGTSAAPPALEQNVPDVEMNAALDSSIVDRIDALSVELSAGRRKRKTPEGLATVDEIAALTTLNTAKEPATTHLDVLSTAEHGSWILQGGADGTCAVVDQDSGKTVASTKAHKKSVTSVAWVDDHSFLSSSLDGSVKLWHLEQGGKGAWKIKIDGEVSSVFEAMHDGGISGLSLHPSKSIFATAGTDSTWKLCDVETKAVLDTVSSSSPFSAIQFHPDGLIMATGQKDAQIRLWDVKSRTVATTFSGHDSPVTSLAFSENGYYFASASQDSNVVKIWDLRKAALVQDVEIAEPVTSLRFDYSGKYLGVGSSSGVA
ncbi:hypothetical protein HDU91_002330 [Kappamyces sp. JEL0680]|nr:hypothetical protein HDU91_002330 [Kappamyces sp. JEL0680]